MKIFVIAVALLIFSGVTTIYNESGIFNSKLYEPGYNVSQSEIRGIYEIDPAGTVDSKEGIIDKIAGGFEFSLKIIGIVWKTLGLATNLGSLFTQYVPGDIGIKFGLLITTITWFLYAWGGVQLWQKISSKTMD